MSRRSHKSPWEDRTRERKLAFQILYGLSFSEIPDLDALQTAFHAFPRTPDRESLAQGPEGFAWDLVRGVWDNEKFLDRDIEKFSHNWRIERMGRLELLLLRMALHEIMTLGTPGKVAIAEYLALADSFGAESAKSFMNGIMDAASRSAQKAAQTRLLNN